MKQDLIGLMTSSACRIAVRAVRGFQPRSSEHLDSRRKHSSERQEEARLEDRVESALQDLSLMGVGREWQRHLTIGAKGLIRSGVVSPRRIGGGLRDGMASLMNRGARALDRLR